jgi:2-oxoglutarate ferredoxin oxidoreductase subunit delta
MAPQGRIEVCDIYCKGCEICTGACPQGVLALAPNRMNAKGFHPVELIEQGCTGCGICAIVCPEAAITVYREVKSQTPKE